MIKKLYMTFLLISDFKRYFFFKVFIWNQCYDKKIIYNFFIIIYILWYTYINKNNCTTLN